MQPLEKSLSISETIADQLTENILSGDLPGGTELAQEELADTFGVSRMPVRDALSSLEKRGLVERLPNRHIRVSRVTGEHIGQIYAMAAVCQAQCLEDLADDRARWAAFAAQAPAGASGGEMLAFHRALVQAVSCVYLRSLLGDMVECYVRAGLHAPGAACVNAFARYRLAIQAKDLPACRRALQEHYKAMGQEMLRRLEQANDQTGGPPATCRKGRPR